MSTQVRFERRMQPMGLITITRFCTVETDVQTMRVASTAIRVPRIQIRRNSTKSHIHNAGNSTRHGVRSLAQRRIQPGTRSAAGSALGPQAQQYQVRHSTPCGRGTPTTAMGRNVIDGNDGWADHCRAVVLFPFQQRLQPGINHGFDGEMIGVRSVRTESGGVPESSNQCVGVAVGTVGGVGLAARDIHDIGNGGRQILDGLDECGGVAL